MNESEFDQLIDCNFPYHDRQEASHLIDMACQISTEAAFMVAHELARPPYSDVDKIDPLVLLEMLSELENKFDHPIKAVIFSICRKMIQRQHLSGEEALAVLNYLKVYPGQFSAAAIVYFSCNDDLYMDQIDQEFQLLIQSWNS
jgi:hypothetical protein